MTELERLQEENENLKANRRGEDVQKWSTLFASVDSIKTSCAGCHAAREIDSHNLASLEATVNGCDSSPGLKGTVAILSQKMWLIQWVVGAVVIATLAAAADRIINRPASCESLEATTHEAVERAADKAAVKATRIIADAKAQEAK